MDRTRTVTWHDPLPIAEKARTMRGLDFLQAMIDGEIPRPPFAYLLGMTLIEVAPGRAVFTVTPAEFLYNPIGLVHGGVAMTILDSATGCAVQTMLEAGVGYTTVSGNTNFIRPITLDTGLLRAEAQTINVGRRIATAEARLVDGAGKLYAHGVSTCAILTP